LGDAGRLERHGDALLRLHRARHGVEQPPIALHVLCTLRRGGEQQRLRIVPRDDAAVHRARSKPSRHSVTRRRLASVSRCASMSFDAAAVVRSTASRRSASTALSFSSAIPFRARTSGPPARHPSPPSAPPPPPP